MKAIVLCAGYATRLYPLTKDTPKPLLMVDERPIVEYILNDLIHIEGLDTIYIITNNKFTASFKAWQKKRMIPRPLEIVNDGTMSNDDRLGAIGDLMYVIGEKNIDDDVLVVAGDNLFELSVPSFVSYAQNKRPAMSIAVYDVEDIELAKRYGVVSINDERRIVKFEEKPPHPATTLASLGLYYFPREMLCLFEKYKAEGNNLDQPGNFVSWCSIHHGVYTYACEGCWFDIGDFTSLEKAQKYYSQKK